MNSLPISVKFVMTMQPHKVWPATSCNYFSSEVVPLRGVLVNIKIIWTHWFGCRQRLKVYFDTFLFCLLSSCESIWRKSATDCVSDCLLTEPVWAVTMLPLSMILCSFSCLNQRTSGFHWLSVTTI